MISLRWEKLVHLVRKPWPTEGCHPGSAAIALPTRSRPRGEGQTLRRARKNPLRTRPPHGDGANRMVLFNRRQSSPGCVAGAALGVERKACKNSAVLQTPWVQGHHRNSPGLLGTAGFRPEGGGEEKHIHCTRKGQRCVCNQNMRTRAWGNGVSVIEENMGHYAIRTRQTGCHRLSRVPRGRG